MLFWGDFGKRRITGGCGGGKQGFIEDPLGGAIQEGEERFAHDGAIEPEVHAGDGRIAEMAESRERRGGSNEGGGQDLEQCVVRESGDAEGGTNLGAIVKQEGGKAAFVDAHFAYAGAGAYLAAAGFDGRAAPGIKFSERNGGDAKGESLAIHEEGFPEDIDAIGGAGALEILIEGAHKDGGPEASQGARSLAMELKPLKHGKARGGRRTAGVAEDIEQGAGNAGLIGKAEETECEERRGEMKRGRKEGRADGGAAAIRGGESEAVVEPDFIGGADAPVEISEIGAAAEGDVLAIVDMAAIGKDVGSGAAAQVRAAFEEADAVAGVRERDGRGQTGQAAA